MASNDPGRPSLFGIVVGLLIVAAFAYFLIGDRLGLRERVGEISAPVEPPNVPVTPPPAPQ